MISTCRPSTSTLAMGAAGLRPWAPITDRVRPRPRRPEWQRGIRGRRASAGGFADRYDQVPVMLAVAADLRLLAAVDRDLDRYSMVGGASVYPFVWSILLAAHGRGSRWRDHDHADTSRARARAGCSGCPPPTPWLPSWCSVTRYDVSPSFGARQCRSSPPSTASTDPRSDPDRSVRRQVGSTRRGICRQDRDRGEAHLVLGPSAKKM